MEGNRSRIVLGSAVISSVGVYGIDYFSHLLFSSPMETVGYFVGKLILFFVCSVLFLSLFDLRKNEFVKVSVAGIVVASLWGIYYNILPALFHYYPYGIALSGLTFLGMGLLGTGIAFGVVHTLAFIGGYYANRGIMSLFKKKKQKI